MKNIFKYIAGVLVAGFAMTSCSPEDFTGANGNIPQASDYTDNFKVTVDQTTNYANFEFTSAPGVSPIWIIDGAYQASYGFSKYYRKKGSYTVECKVKNANGISDGSITKTFEIEKTIMNGFGGFVEDSEFNMFKGVTFNVASFYYAPGWGQIADPKYTYQNGAFVVSLPEATTDQWQAQMHVELDKVIALSVDKTYDFSVIITSTTKHPGVTVKVQQKGDDNTFINMQRVALDANEPKCIWFSNVPGVNITDLKFALDFGGNEANTDITLESFVLKDHANDDGTEIPEVQEPEPSWVKVDSEDNLWNGATFTNTIDHGNRIEQPVYISFIKTDWDHYLQAGANSLEIAHCRIFHHRCGKLIVIISALLAKILAFKQLRKKDHLRSFCCCLTYQNLCFFYVFCYISAAAHLNCGTSYVSHLLFLLLSFNLTFLFMFDPLFFQRSKGSHHFYIR